MIFTGSLRLRLATAATAAAAIACGALAVTGSAGPERAASIGELSQQLAGVQARQQSLSASLARLGQMISALDGQIALVQSREAAVRRELANDRATLAHDKVVLARERRTVAALKAKLARARMILSKQLVSSYESDQPNLVTVVLDAHGFTNLLDQLNFLGRAEHEQQSMIKATKQAKAQADAAERRLAKAEATEVRVTNATAVRERALAGMNSLLQGKQAALGRARAAQQAALGATQARGARLQGQIAQIRAAQAAAAQRAAAAAAAAAASTNVVASRTTAAGPTLGASGGWAIPYAIVLCESGGQDLPPNGAGASGYYQIMPATWRLFGGSGPAAYLASKGEQDAVAARIWNGGAGAHNWVCAGIVGIH